MYKYTLAVEDTFSSAHRLPGHKKCGDTHGHTWKVRVELMDFTKEPVDGILVDFDDVKATIRRYDHTYLNNFMDFPSAENIAARIYDTIKGSHPHFDVVVTVWESENTSVRLEAL